MSLPLLSASAFQELLDLVKGDSDAARRGVPPTDETPADDEGFAQQFFVDWEVPQAS